ncbi:MAG: lactonase family protein, partial [Opitutaceae bacterium]
AGGGILRIEIAPDGGPAGAPKRVSDRPRACFFLAAHPRRPVLYAVDAANGSLEAYAADRDGSLRLLATRDYSRAAPCHIAVDPRGRFVLIAQYRGGVRLLPLGSVGGLNGEDRALRFPDLGSDGARPAGSRPHGVTFDAGGRMAYVCDLGLDRIFGFRRRSGAAGLEPDAEATVSAARGAGPRHLALSPDGGLAAVVNELDNTLGTYRVDRSSGRLAPADVKALLPPGFSGTSWAAEAAFHPSGTVCYASNRGHESLAALAVDPQSGRLGPPRWIDAGGARPTHFVFNPAGDRLWVANEDSNCLATGAVDPRTGRPEGPLHRLAAPRPSCLLLWPF